MQTRLHSVCSVTVSDGTDYHLMRAPDEPNFKHICIY